MSGIIYYPSISLPPKAWTYRQLLYYDEISVIVPMEYFDDPALYPPHMQELIREELVIPRNFSGDYDIQNQLHVQFVRYLRNNDFTKRQAAFSGESGGRTASRTIYATKFNPRVSVPGSQIYESKFGPAILHELQELGLARSENHRIYYVEKRTAFELMQFLTSLVAARIEALPVTDRLPLFAVKSQDDIIVRDRNEKRDVLLKNIMPLPQDIDLVRLMKFKDRHNELLKRFRTEIEAIVLNDATAVGTESFDTAMDRIREQRDEITRRMEEYNYRNILRCSVHGMVPFAAAALEGEFNRNVLITGPMTFLIAVATAISNLHPDRIDNTSGMKYLALVHRTFHNFRE
ncbi:hypothetical protein [uncultured Rikenella sp.]|uniref:hypothetical protein n=1 Tax=uncultured Rikenella sp. TaxID=368003 RepID=UPI002729ECB8|nr:hypothetical protein [uncultured Rikenella sp.]